MTARAEVLHEVLDAANGSTVAELREWLEAELAAEKKRQPSTIYVGHLRVDRELRKARIGDQEVNLTMSELECLARLMQTPGRVVCRDSLLVAICQHVDPIDCNPNNCNVIVSRLRRKLRNIGVEIRTMYGAGYALKVPEMAT